MPWTARRRVWFAALLSVVAGCGEVAPAPVWTDTPPAAVAPLNVGRGLLPAVGTVTPVGEWPTAIAALGDRAVVVGGGCRPTLDVVPPGRVGSESAADAAYTGVAVAGPTAYAAQGGRGRIAILTDVDGRLKRTGEITTAPGDCPAGLAVSDAGRLFVVDTGAGRPGPQPVGPAGLTIYDPATRSPVGRFAFDNPTHTSIDPLAVAVRRDGTRAYVSSERDGTVVVLDTRHPDHIARRAVVPTGSRPTAVLLSGDGSRLFVANSQSDTVSVVDTATDRVVAVIPTCPGARRGPANATPVGLALSPDGRRVYVALADLNAVGVVDVPSLRTVGLIPAGRYPSAVLATADGHLLVANSRGNDPTRAAGTVQRMPVPTRERLAVMTADVLRAAHLDVPFDSAANPLAQIGRAAGRITHVIYVVNGSGTYDEVLGDDPRGNGDAARCRFGRGVTPNQHALADRFVLLDDTYACGDGTADGWVWSTQGTANAYVNRNATCRAGGDDDGALFTSPVARSAPPLWDAAARAGLTCRTYGDRTTPDRADSDAPRLWFDRTGDPACLYPTAPSRIAEWRREFDQMLARDPTGNGVPNLTLIRLPHDHTQGSAPGRHSPAARVADNDYAVGQLVDRVSHSAIWPHTAIFVIDVAGAGPDHVDGHRTTAYAVSPFVRRGAVDHRFANTDAVLRTVGLLLATDPLCAFDAAAAPLLDWTAGPDNAEPFDAILPPKDVIAQTTSGGGGR